MNHNTESINPNTSNLDLLETTGLVEALASDQLRAVQAVLEAQAQIATAVDATVPRLERGGRLLYAGAGTSGRLSFLDAAELTPTFSWPRERALVAMAGGVGAIVQAVEGAEDDFEQGKRDLLAFSPTVNDVLLGVAASGSTPYVLGAIEVARAAGALSIGIACNPGAPVLQAAELAIPILTGPEAISGSTRLKAGTAQKITLNTFSSAVMVRLGKVHGNLMVDVQATNKKLVMRAIRLTCLATRVTPDRAEEALRACGWQVKTAILMLEKSLDAKSATALLEQCEGRLRLALKD